MQHESCCGYVCSFFFQAEDGIRDLVRSRGLGDVYKRQVPDQHRDTGGVPRAAGVVDDDRGGGIRADHEHDLSLIHN